MDPLYLRKIRIDRLTNQQIKNLAQNVNAPESEVVQNEPQPDSKPSLTNLSSQSERLMKEMREEMLSPKQLKMNYLASMERSAYVKKIMNLPSTLPELLIQLQNPALAKDVHNVMMQPFPEPDTQKPDLKQTDKTNPDGQNKNSNNNNDNAKNNLNSNNDGFQDVLQRENNRKQAILEQYNVNNNVQNQPQNPVRGAINHNVIVSNNQVTNPEITVLNNEGVNNQVSNNEQIQIQPQGVNNTPPTVPNTQPVVNNNSTPQPVVNNEGVNNVQQPTVPNTQPVVNNNPTPQPVVNNEGVNNTPPTVPNTQPVVNNNPTPQPVVNNEGINNVQQPTVPNTQPVVNNNPTPQPVVNNEGVNNVQQPTVPNTQPVVNNNPTSQPVVNNEGVNNVQQPTVPNTQPVVNNNPTPQPVVNNEGVNNTQPTVPNTPPVVNNNPTSQPVVNNEGVNNTQPTVPNTPPVVNNNPTPQPVVNNEGVNIVQQPTVPNTQPVVNNNPTPQPVVNNEGVNNVQQPTVPNTQPVVNNNPTPQPVVNNEGVNIVQQRPIDRVPIDNHRQPIENRRDIGINDRPPIEFKPVDTRFNYDPTRQIIDARIAMDRPPINPLNDRPFIDNRRPIIPMHEPEPEMPKPTELKQTEAAANLYANLSMNDINNPTLTQMRQRLSDDAIELLFTGLINLNELSDTIKHNGHDARSKLILAMANASRQGIDNSQIASTMKMVSESMASEENNPASILKNIIMLYLPWYPLQDGVGFNLSIETMPNSSDFSSLLKVFIQTRNYGNVNGSLVLLTGNAVDMNIQCNDAFPKSDLLDRMKEVTENHSIQSNITVEEHVQMANEMANQQAKVNLSSTFELNPFLLLMAHSFIKNTIIIDSNKIV